MQAIKYENVGFLGDIQKASQTVTEFIEHLHVPRQEEYNNVLIAQGKKKANENARKSEDP